ncbi:MAG: hypothetical protein ACRD0P_00285 [Stackebrandtia sp.]
MDKTGAIIVAKSIGATNSTQIEKGTKSVRAAVTHGVFTERAVPRLDASTTAKA